MPRDRKGGSDFVFIVLFGVIIAIVTGGVLAVFYLQQLNVRVGLEAQSLADELARTSFSSLGGGQPKLELPIDVGGSEYQISIEDNRTFVVRITAGRLRGNRYTSQVGVDLQENEGLTPGAKAYFQLSGTRVVVSASPIEVPGENILPTTAATPPNFYDFAKENHRAAAAIIAAYFDVSQNIDAYQENTNSVIVRTGSAMFCVQGYENGENVGLIDNAWVIENIENYAGEFTGVACPSVENAYLSGWLYPPSQALSYLRSRTWQRTSDNFVVVIPGNAKIRAAAAKTNVSTYPTWRIEWQADNYCVLHYRAMPWWWAENDPGFVLQSEPPLEVA